MANLALNGGTAVRTKPYPGWPRTISQQDNYGRKAVAYLPTLKISGRVDPVIQVVDDGLGDVLDLLAQLLQM